MACVAAGYGQQRELSYACPNSQKLIIPRSGMARTAGGAAYSEIVLSGVPGEFMFSVGIQIRLFNQHRPMDLDIVVVSPEGDQVLVMSDAGGSRGNTPITSQPLILKFSDDASNVLPESTFATSGVYLPTNYDTGDSLPAPAPPPPYDTSLSVFSGNPNGAWRLYVFDDSGFWPQDTQILDWRIFMKTDDSDSVNPPAADNFGNAVNLNPSSASVLIKASGAAPTLQASEPALCLGLGTAPCVNQAKGSVWMKYTPREDGIFKFQFDKAAYVSNNSYEYSHMLAMYSGSGLSNLTAAGSGYDQLSARVTKGVTYYIRADGYGEDFYWDVYASYALLTGSSISRNQQVGVTSTFNGYQLMFYDFDFNDTRITTYASSTAQHGYQIRTGWIGMYLYDYHIGSFSEAIYAKRSDVAPTPMPEASPSEETQSLSMVHLIPKNTGAGARITLNQSVIGKKDIPECTGYQELVYNYSTAAQSVSPYSNDTTAAYFFPMPVNNWIGMFHYDYLSARFREFDQRLKQEM